MIRPQLAEFMRRMDQNSVAIIPSAREATRSNDTAYRFRQDSDFLYLTGFEEPDAIAIIGDAGALEAVVLTNETGDEQIGRLLI